MCELAEDEAANNEPVNDKSVAGLEAKDKRQWRLTHELIETAIVCSILKARFSLLNM
jgi:hypothetical protein